MAVFITWVKEEGEEGVFIGRGKGNENSRSELGEVTTVIRN